MGKKVAAHVCAVGKAILFIGLSIQIILGVVWMCCNFAHVPMEPEAEAVVYSLLLKGVGGRAPIMYLLQLLLAFVVNFYFLQSILPVKRWFAVWRALAMLTFPFAMQCHLSLQPQSLVGSLFLACLLFGIKAIRGGQTGCSEHDDCVCKKANAHVSSLCIALVGLVLLVGMSGVTDRRRLENLSERGVEGLLVSRISWSTIDKDEGYWPEELREVVGQICRDVGFFPHNIELLYETIEGAFDKEKAREYYAMIARTSWGVRYPVVIRQIAWDVLGYTFSPIVVPMQLAGDGYDSYTARNYENMRNNNPILTKCYVDYSCWWFVIMLSVSAVMSFISAAQAVCDSKVRKEENNNAVRKSIWLVLLCVAVSGVWVLVFVMRGGGMMDYRWTIGVNLLWFVVALLCMGSREKQFTLENER